MLWNYENHSVRTQIYASIAMLYARPSVAHRLELGTKEKTKSMLHQDHSQVGVQPAENGKQGEMVKERDKPGNGYIKCWSKMKCQRGRPEGAGPVYGVRALVPCKVFDIEI
jgi:hypothetical protein